MIPAFNAEPYIAETVASVLEQTLAPAEVLVIDDGSSDRTAELARAFGGAIRCIPQPRAGIGAALNRGIELARGVLIAFVDADDLWVPEKLALQLGALHSRPGSSSCSATSRSSTAPS